MNRVLALRAAVAAGAVLALSVGCSAKPKPATAAETRETAPPPATTVVPSPEPAAPAPVVTSESDALPVSVSEINRRGYLKDVFFDFDQAAIRADGRGVLSSDATWLTRWPSVKIMVEGHCDERGTQQYNMALGEKRAEAVKEYLETLGVPEARIQIVSYGKERPFATGHDETAWSQNRRDHFVVTAR